MGNYYKIARQLSAAALLSITTINAMAQSDAATLIRAGVDDANVLMGAYGTPLMKSLGAGMNSGWFQTAKPHGLGGFDLTFSANLGFAPSADQSFDVAALQSQLKKTRLSPGQSTTTSPTALGEGKQGPQMEVYEKSPFTGNDSVYKTFRLPQGIGVPFFPVPTAQLCVGVGFGTEVAVRFIPTIKVQDASAGLFGFAIKHDIKQWIPVVKNLPFDLSAMFAYTTMDAEVKFTGDNAIKPVNDPNVYNPDPSKPYDNQKMTIETKAWTTNLLISKKLGPFTPYLGLGYQKSKSDLKLSGDYPVVVPNGQFAEIGDPSFGKAGRISDIKDPVSVSGDLSGFRTTLGFRLKITVLTIHADYTFGQYNVASAGLGINIQSLVPPSL